MALPYLHCHLISSHYHHHHNWCRASIILLLPCPHVIIVVSSLQKNNWQTIIFWQIIALTLNSSNFIIVSMLNKNPCHCFYSCWSHFYHLKFIMLSTSVESFSLMMIACLKWKWITKNQKRIIMINHSQTLTFHDHPCQTPHDSSSEMCFVFTSGSDGIFAVGASFFDHNNQML